MLRYFLVLLILLVSSVSNAKCNHNGISYPTGEEIDGYVCSADGSWVKK